MKLTSNQIIAFIIAFLIGVAVASAVLYNKKDADIMEEEAMEESMDESEEADEASEADEAAAAVAPTTTNGTAPATTTKPSTEFVTGKCSTGLSGYKDEKLNAIVLNWSPCASDDFQFYKLVKSSIKTSPSYPADPVAFSSSNKNAANFVDKTVAARTTYYYRMCVVQRLGQVNCSNVASVSF